jgi:hypothetical protein
MDSKGMQLGGDLDNLAFAKPEEFDAVLKKFCATKNIKPETAIRWALQRSRNDSERQSLKEKFQQNYQSGTALL